MIRFLEGTGKVRGRDFEVGSFEMLVILCCDSKAVFVYVRECVVFLLLGYLDCFVSL